jgi:hypothetical protein
LTSISPETIESTVLKTGRSPHPNLWLNRFSKNVTSQCGEDGIIEKILDVMGDNNKWCVEFGAWDGKNLSNTFNLIQNKDYSAVLIEPDSDRFKELVATHQSNQKVFPINAFVGFEEHDSLDVHLRTTDIPTLMLHRCGW